MDDERVTLSFSAEELKEAEELNTLSDTRMTEEYKEFLQQELGDAVEPCLRKGDSAEAGSYYEDDFAGQFDSGFRSNLVEPEMSGSFSMDGSADEPEDTGSFSPDDFADDSKTSGSFSMNGISDVPETSGSFSTDAVSDIPDKSSDEPFEDYDYEDSYD